MTTDKTRAYAAVDIGGTKVAAGIVETDGTIVYRTRVPMVTTEGPDVAFRCVKDALQNAIAHAGVRELVAIGVSAAGPLDPHTGVVLNPPNMPCWRNFPLGELVAKGFELPVTVENDANAAGLAEAKWGAGKGFRNVFYTTVGTGIGTGLVLDGKIYNGRTGLAPEAGHITIDYRGALCGCGKRGCIEALASGTGIAKRARAAVAAGRGNSMMLKLANGDENAISTEMVAAAWRAGDAEAAEVLHETMELLTVWLGCIVDTLEPDVIVFGGGVGELMSEWFPHVSELLPKWCLNQRCGEIPLKLAHYNADAGIAGAAALCAAQGAHATVSVDD